MTDEASRILLVIDHDAAVREKIAASLEDRGYTVHTAADGRTGLEKFEAVRPHGVIVDLHLPGIDGLEVLSRVRRASAALPIAVLAEAADAAGLVEALHAGAWDLILKPIADMTLVVHSLESILERARLKNENERYRNDLESEVARRTRQMLQAGRALRADDETNDADAVAPDDRESLLQSIVRTVPDIIYRLDDRGRITFISDAVRKYGYAPEELLGSHILDLVHPDDRERATDRLDERRTGPRATRDLEIRLLPGLEEMLPSMLLPDGTAAEPVFLIDAVGLYDAFPPGAESFGGTQGIARDITWRKHRTGNRETR